jgi:hypothetical protein
MKLEGRAWGVRCTGIAYGYNQIEKEIMVVYDHNRSLLLALSLQEAGVIELLVAWNSRQYNIAEGMFGLVCEIM